MANVILKGKMYNLSTKELYDGSTVYSSMINMGATGDGGLEHKAVIYLGSGDDEAGREMYEEMIANPESYFVISAWTKVTKNNNPQYKDQYPYNVVFVGREIVERIDRNNKSQEQQQQVSPMPPQPNGNTSAQPKETSTTQSASVNNDMAKTREVDNSDFDIEDVNNNDNIDPF